MSNIKKVLVDYREVSNGIAQQNFKQQIISHFGEDKVFIESLPIGDFVVILNDGTVFVVERKEDLDWISSCIKRRVQSQVLKMVEAFDHRFVIIIGDYKSIQNNRQYVKFSKKQWISNMISLGIRYKTPVYMVESKLDFLKAIDSIAKMIDRETEPLEKPKNIKNTGNPKTDILGAVPGIGKKKSEKLLLKFGSIKNIINSSADKISEVNGVSKNNAEEILRWFN